METKVETIKIAPKLEGIKFSEDRNRMYVVFNGMEISYLLPPGVVFSKNDDYHKQGMRSAIIFCSEIWQLESSLNTLYKVRGIVKTKKVEESK